MSAGLPVAQQPFLCERQILRHFLTMGCIGCILLFFDKRMIIKSTGKDGNMKKKIAACILAVTVGIAGIPVPASAQQIFSESGTKSTDAVRSPLEEIHVQDYAMEQQEEIEEEENMPAEEPDPLVLDDDGSVVPASAAAWVEDEVSADDSDSEESGEYAGEDMQIHDKMDETVSGQKTQEKDQADFSDGDSVTAESAADDTQEDMTDGSDNDIQEESSAVSEIPEEPDQKTTQNDLPEDDLTGEENQPSEDLSDNPSAGELSEKPEELTEEPQEPDELEEDPSEKPSDSSEETISDGSEEEFSDGEALAGGTGTYQVETLQIREGQDITAPLNTLFLKLKNRATGQTPYKIIIPPGHYKLTGTLCMYSNMYLYAQGATITKTSRTKHLILRLGNTKESAGGYSGYQNIVIDGGTWNYNYQCVKGKDEPGGFVGFCIGHANNVTIKNATFLNNLKSHFLEFGGVKNATIRNCKFRGYYKNYEKGGQECIQIDCCTDEGNVFPQYMPYDGSTCEDFLIEGNTFEDVFAGVGTHSMMAGKTYKRITVKNNTFRNIRKRCIEFLNYTDSVAENNTMINVGVGVDVSSVNKKNTHLTKGYTGDPDVNTDRKIRIYGNKISLSGVSSIAGVGWVCSGIKVFGFNMEENGGVVPRKVYPVKGVTVKNNQISGYGNGIIMKLTNTATVFDNQMKMKKPSVYSNIGIYAEDSRGTSIKKNTVSGTANTGIYFYDAAYSKNSQQKNYIQTNVVSLTGGDGIYLQRMSAASRIEKNTVKSVGGSGIHVKDGKMAGIYSNTVSSNKNHGIRIEYTTGGIWIRGNQVVSNKNCGIMLGKGKVSQVAGNTIYKNSKKGMYINGTDIWEVRDNTVTENGDAQEVYANNCKKLCSIRRPVCKKITTKSTDVAGTADGGYTVTVYAWISGKSQKLGTARVNTKKQFTVKIKKQKKNTVLKIVSKDRYGNAVSVNYTVK